MASDPSPALWRNAAILGAAAELLFAFRLTTPRVLVFDEVHYVPAARKLLALAGPANIEHPLLAKEMLAAGIALFGDNPLGWRFFATLAGTATVLGVYACAWLLFGRVRVATVAGLLALCNLTIFVEARTAMLDGVMAACVVTGLAAWLWAMRAPPHRVWLRWGLACVLLGLAVGAKWAAVPFVAYAAIGLVALRLRDWRRGDASIYAVLNGTRQPHWAGLPVVPALIALGCVSVGVYFLTFAPAFFYAVQPLTMRELLPFQQQMYALQTQVLPHHPYQSAWWSWPLLIRPIWYLYERVDGAMRGVLMIGNPAVMWGGLVAVAWCLRDAWRNGAGAGLGAALLWIGSYGVWALIPKSLGFYYYYYLPSILIALPLAGALQDVAIGKRRHWDTAFVVLAGALFVYFYPIVAALPLAGPRSFQWWMWFPSWI